QHKNMHAVIAPIWHSSHIPVEGRTSGGRRSAGLCARDAGQVEPDLSDRLVKALRSRTGLLDEVDGAALALKDARQVVRARRGDCNVRIVRAFAVHALPALPLDHDAGVIAGFDVEPLDFVEV